MRFTYHINMNDLKEAHQAHAKQTAWKYHLLMMATVFIVNVLPLLSRGSVTISDILVTLILPYLIFLTIFYAIFQISQNFAIKQAWKSQPMLQSEIIADTTTDGLQIQTELSQSNVRWSVYTHWKETANLFMIYQSHNIFNLVPKRAFSTEADLNEFRELLRNHLPKK